MSTRGLEFIYKWISEHMPDGPIDDPGLLVIDMADQVMRAADAEGIAIQEIDEEIGSVYEAIIHAVEHREGGLAG
ncbi:hypothetical protein AJ88_13870 [Mesorhizobium amorphae CCBAU 01583]|nr:hypothetical protein AJ88_13870 [Mesorhizobium amorphae CCBAU 01583]